MTALALRHRLARELRRSDPFRPVGRKTVRVVQARRKPTEMPDWCLRFAVTPSPMAWGLPQGIQPDTAGSVVLEHEAVTVTGKSRAWVLHQAATYLRRIGQGHMPLRIVAHLRRCTDTGKDVVLVIDASGAAEIDGHTMRRIEPVW